MIFSLIRGGLVLLLAGVLTYFLISIDNVSGSLSIQVQEKEIKFSLLLSFTLLLIFGFLFWFLLKTLGFFLAVSDFIMGKDTALLRFFKKIRYRKSQKALNNAVVALAEGESMKILSETAKARVNPDFTKIVQLLNAQAEERLGNQERADAIYKKLLSDKDTRLVALKGLIRSKIAKGDTTMALELAEKAVLMKPKSLQGLRTLFSLQCEDENWSGARKTLIAQQNLEKNTKEIRLRQEAVILYADASKKRSDGDIDLAAEKIKESVRKSPSLVPSVCLASELEIILGKTRNSENLIKSCWRIEPHPDLAKSFASLYPNETPLERLKRFKPLFIDI